MCAPITDELLAANLATPHGSLCMHGFSQQLPSFKQWIEVFRNSIPTFVKTALQDPSWKDPHARQVCAMCGVRAMRGLTKGCELPGSWLLQSQRSLAGIIYFQA